MLLPQTIRQKIRGNKMKNKINLTLLFFAITIQYSFAQNNLQYVSKVCAGSPTNAILNGNYLYVIDIGLVVFDFSIPSSPTLVNHLTPMEGMYTNNELIIIGDTGYATWDGGGIMRMDFSNPASPTPISYLLNNSYDYQNLLLKFPYLYAIAKSQSTDSLYLQSIDINNGIIFDSVNLESSFQHIAFEAKRFIIDGNYLYLTMGPRGVIDTTELHIFDISAPSNISHIDSSTVYLGKSSAIPAILQNSHWDLVKKNNFIYVAAWFDQPKSKIKIVDVTNPLSPAFVKEWMDTTITGGSGDIEISGNNLFLTDLSSSFNVISLANDTTLSLCKRINNGLAPLNAYNTNFFMTLFGNYAFLFNLDNYAVYTFEVSLPCNTELIDTIPFAHDWKDIGAKDTNSVFASVWNFYQLYSFDVSDEMNPVISHRTEVKGSGWGIDVKNNFAYLAMGMQNPNYPPTTKSGGLIVYDISNPNQPLEKGWSPPDTLNNEVQVFVNPQSNLAYVIAGQPNSEGESSENHISNNPGLRIVDVSNPDSLIQSGKINITPQCRGIFQEGNYAYMAASSPDSSTVIDTSGLYIVNVSNPTNPSVTGKWVCTNPQHLEHNGHTRAVCIKNGYAYLAHSGNMVVMDVSNPTSPLLVNEISLGNSQTMDVAVSDNFVFTLTQKSLFVFDISNPVNPVPVDSVTGFFAPFRHFDIKPPYIYVLSGAGVFIFKFDGLVGIEEKNKERGIDLTVYPNPFSGMTTLKIIPQDGKAIQDYELKIYDLPGKEVKKYEIKNIKTEIPRDDLPSGMYFYQVKTGKDFISSGKLIVQ